MWVMPLHRRLFYLLILLLPVQLGYHLWPDWTIVLGRRIDYLSPTLFATDCIAVAVMVAWGLHGAGSAGSRITVPMTCVRFMRRWWVPLLLFVLTAVTNTVFSAVPANTALKWMKCIEIVGIAAYVYVTYPDPRRVAMALTVPVVYSSIIAMWQIAVQHSIGGFGWYLGERTFSVSTPGIARLSYCIPPSVMLPFTWMRTCPELLRPYATFPHPNVLGGFIAALMGIFISELVHAVRTRIRVWYACTVLIAGIGMAVTFSRSAWMACLVGLTIFTRREASAHAIRNGWFVLTAAVLVISGVAAFAVTGGQSESVTMRMDLVRASLTMIGARGMLGVGLGNFIPELPQFTPLRSMYFLQPVHNIYLLSVAELGATGMLLLVGAAVMVLRVGIPLSYVPPASDRRMLSSFAVAGAVLLMLGIVDHYPVTLQQTQLLLGVVAAYAARLLPLSGRKNV